MLASNSSSGNLAQMRGKIGIISPYKEQVHLLRRKISQIGNRLKLGTSSEETEGIEINTVDAFQGREKDIIIISTVRTEGLGFLNDLRRMNVAITRAKHFMWIVGSKRALNRNEVWGALIH